MNVTTIVIDIAGLTTAITIILAAINKIFNKAMKPIYDKIDNLDKNQCKAYLVNFLTDLERGEEKDEVQIKLAYEIYDRYKNDLHCNSYIHDKWERLIKKEV